VEAVDTELDNRVQRLRVDLPYNAPELISKLRNANVNFDAHPVAMTSDLGLFGNLSDSIDWWAIFPFVALVTFRAAHKPLNLVNPRPLPNGSQNWIKFDDVAGIDEAKEELQEVVTKQPERFTAIGARIPKGVLLVGLLAPVKLY